MIFKSQICTSREQSERLLALGLKPETADMGWGTITLNGEPITFSTEDSWDDVEITEIHIPAWSLHRLMSLVFNSGGTRVELFEDDDAYEILIYEIEMRIKKGYFNKEYLD